jgi:topoisomerase-4 subunit A
LVLASKNGQIKRTRVKDLGIAKLPKVSNVMTLDENDRLISAALASSDKVETNVSVVTKDGNAIAYPIDQIPVIGKNGSGVKNLNLKDNDSIAAIFLNESSKEYVVIACEQGAKRIKTSSITIGKRTNQPKSVVLQSKTNPLFVINAFAVSNSDKISVLDSSNK